MNYKGLAYDTVWVDGGEIESVLKAHGIPPLDHRADGSPRYTLPSLIDATGAGEPVKLADSKLIVEYLEATYPNPDPAKALFPRGTEALQELAYHDITERLQMPILHATLKEMKEKQTEGMIRTFGYLFGDSLKDAATYEVAREKAWLKVLEELEALSKIVGMNSLDGTKRFFLGEDISFVDLHVAAILIQVKLSIGDEEFNRRLGSCSGGRWIRHAQMFAKYM